MEHTAERLAEVRRARGLSQTELGDLLGVTGAWVHGREAGKVSPTIEDLTRLAVVLDVPTATLLEPPLSQVLPRRGGGILTGPMSPREAGALGEVQEQAVGA